MFFYWWGAPTFAVVVLGTSSLNFIVAQQLVNSIHKKRFLWLYVGVNLGLLAYFKYMNFFVENFNELILGMGFEAVHWSKVVLPIGISFFTFQSITYGVDVYRGDAKPQKSIGNYLLYILFFPQLIAGPIVTYRSIATQLTNREHSLDNFLNGFWRFTIGLCKKVLVANVVAEYSSLLVEQDMLYYPDSTLIAWITALAYTFEIYFDFSGYSDMAIGLGKMFGFTFPENFDRPYLSQSITEFWRRWHITLGNFMKNYLYIPLGGNRVSPNRVYINLLTVFALSGLWHGASWNFLVWGLFHGFWLVIERLVKIKLPKSIKPFKVLITFIIVLHGWVLFDAATWAEAWNHLKAMYAFQNFDYFLEKNSWYYEVHMIIAAVLILLGTSKRLNQLYSIRLAEVTRIPLRFVMTGLMLLAFMICLSHIVVGSFNPFIYFQF